MFGFMSIILTLRVPTSVFQQSSDVRYIRQFRYLVLYDCLLRGVVMNSNQHVCRFALRIVRPVTIVFRVTSSRTIRRTRRTLSRRLRKYIIQDRLRPLYHLYFKLYSIPRGSRHVIQIPSLTTRSRVTSPSFLPVRGSTTLLTRLNLGPLRFFNSMNTIMRVHSLLFILFSRVIIRGRFSRLIPYLTLLGNHRRKNLRLRNVRNILFRVRVVFTRIHINRHTIRHFHPLHLRPTLLFFLGITSSTNSTTNHTVRATSRFYQNPRPLV